jgi:hypothetical protein
MLLQAKVRVAQTLLSVLVRLGSHRAARRRAAGSGFVDQISIE